MTSGPIRIRCIDHINMRVNNLAESIAFYGDVFGFEVKEDYSHLEAEPWVILGQKDTVYLCLYEHPDKRQAKDALRINHFGLAVEDFDAARERLEQLGVEILYGGPVDWPHSRSLYIRDPSGHEIELPEKVGGGLH
jgi:catechol 2,3-dioxygenase-like lactoylglutathione lyase family enzyme